MAETFCPECGTVFESTGSVCPNCAANVGNAGYKPKGNKDSGLSVMPLAKSSGEVRGIAGMDGDNLQLRDRSGPVTDARQQAHQPQGEPEASGLSLDGPERSERELEPELPPEPRASAAQAAEQRASGGLMKPIIVVFVLIAVAVGGKYVMDAVKDKAPPPPEVEAPEPEF